MPPNHRRSRISPHDERGQSEVTGMILLVGLLAVSTTLIGGVMITNFMGAAAGQGPTTDVAVEATGGNVTITHIGGDSIADSDMLVIISGSSGETRYALDTDALAWEGDGDQWFEPGETAVFEHTYIGEISVRVVDREAQTLLYDSTMVPEAVGDPANFSVTIDNTNEPVRENETLEVRATIENVGDQTGLQTVELSVDGNEVDSQAVRLAGGAKEQIELTWSTNDDDDGDHTITVSSEDDSASRSVTIRTDAYFSVSITGTNSPVNESKTVHVDATISNTGGDPEVQVIPLEISGFADPVDYVTVGLNPGDSQDVTLNWSTKNGDAGTYDATVSSLDESKTTSVQVNGSETPPYFNVTIDSTNSPVAEGETVTVDATIENQGDLGGTQTISLSVEGVPSAKDSKDVNLSGGASTTVTLSWSKTNGKGRDTPYNVTISSTNTSDSTLVNVTKSTGPPPGITADAGGTYNVSSGGTITLEGSASQDTNSVQYEWSIVSGGGSIPSPGKGKTVEYTAPTVSTTETVIVELTVSDGPESDTDQAEITVSPEN